MGQAALQENRPQLGSSERWRNIGRLVAAPLPPSQTGPQAAPLPPPQTGPQAAALPSTSQAHHVIAPLPGRGGSGRAGGPTGP